MLRLAQSVTSQSGTESYLPQRQRCAEQRHHDSTRSVDGTDMTPKSIITATPMAVSIDHAQRHLLLAAMTEIECYWSTNPQSKANDLTTVYKLTGWLKLRDVEQRITTSFTRNALGQTCYVTTRNKEDLSQFGHETNSTLMP